MPAAKDLWYIRLPDGRILRAAGASVIRQQLAAGRLPPGTRVRQSLEEEWRLVERIPEFADVSSNGSNGTAAPPTIASRLDPAQMHLAGVRSLVEELVGALDSTATARKLGAAALAGVLLGGLAAVEWLDREVFSFRVPGLIWLLGGAALLVWSWLAAVLSKMTFTELSRLRPARWKDGLEGGFAATIHLALAQGLVVAALGGAILGLRLLPAELLAAAPGGDLGEALAVVAQAAAVVGLVLEFVLWPLLLLTLPMGAIIAVEQGSYLSAIRQWLSLVWRKTGRLLLAEGLALGVGLVIAAPLLLLGALLIGRGETVGVVAAEVARRVLLGLLAAMFLAYLVVANVFIYLNLRYEGDRR